MNTYNHITNKIVAASSVIVTLFIYLQLNGTSPFEV